MSHTAITRSIAYAKVVFRRKLWFEQNGPCCGCGSAENLELDHIDPATKLNHAIWSWTKVKREAELAKCQALCHDCHTAKSRKENQDRMLGAVRARKITPDQVEQMRTMRAGGMSFRAIGREIGLDHKGVSDYIQFGRQRSTLNKSGKAGPRQYLVADIIPTQPEAR